MRQKTWGPQASTRSPNPYVWMNALAIDWTMVGAIASALTVAIAVATILIKIVRATHITKYCFSTIAAVTKWSRRRTLAIAQNTALHLREKYRHLEFRWVVWRKTVHANIRQVISQDKTLREKSATETERIGMAAIMLSQVLSNGAPIQNETCKAVFVASRQNNDALYHLLCARIAADIVTNQDALAESDGSNYVFPWDSILELFLKEVLDEATPQAASGAS